MDYAVLRSNSEKSINLFLDWLQSNGYHSYDQYDFWATNAGIFAKKIFYKSNLLGSPLVAPIVIADLFFPSVRKLFCNKKRFPIADAHIILGLLNIYEYNQDGNTLSIAKKIAVDLLHASIKGYSGNCWGYPFDWQTTRGLWRSGTPLITNTPYCFEAFLKLYDVTKDESYLKIAESSLQFAINDLNDTDVGNDAFASSYSPIDKSFVINASAYRAFMLLEGYRRFGLETAYKKAIKNVNFVLNNQRTDGSWLYAAENSQDAFVDNIHTCFVLKNLFKANLVLKNDRVNNAVKNGYDYYKNNLFYENGYPKPFSEIKRFAPAKVEFYDFAEGISLGILLKDTIDGAFDLSVNLAKKLLDHQQAEGYFTTRIGMFDVQNNVPYLRWPQAQLFFSITKLLSF